MRTKEEIRQILEEARVLQVEQVDIDGVKYTLPKNIGFPRSALIEDRKPEEIIAPLAEIEEYSDEEVLYWATPYFDQLQEEKERKQKQFIEDQELKEGKIAHG